MSRAKNIVATLFLFFQTLFFIWSVVLLLLSFRYDTVDCSHCNHWEGSVSRLHQYTQATLPTLTVRCSVVAFRPTPLFALLYQRWKMKIGTIRFMSLSLLTLYSSVRLEKNDPTLDCARKQRPTEWAVWKGRVRVVTRWLPTRTDD